MGVVSHVVSENSDGLGEADGDRLWLMSRVMVTVRQTSGGEELRRPPAPTPSPGLGPFQSVPPAWQLIPRPAVDRPSPLPSHGASPAASYTSVMHINNCDVRHAVSSF